MRLLIIINSFWPGFKGGGPRESLLHLLKEIDCNVYVFTRSFDFDGQPLDVTPDRWIDWPLNKNVKIYYSSRKGVRYSYTCLKVLLNSKPDVVWVNSFFDIFNSLIPQIFSFLLCIPTCISPRGEFLKGNLSTKSTRKKLFLGIYKIFEFFYPCIYHFTYEDEFKESANYLNIKSHIIWDNYSRKPVTTQEFNSYIKFRSKTKRLVYLARLVPTKGLDTALEVLSKLDSSYTLDIYGSFETQKYKNLIDNDIVRLNLEDRICFKGFVPFDLAQENLNSNRLLLSTTKGENFGHSIYGLISLGIPVVISDKTPWKKRPGVRVCRRDNVEDYVLEILNLEDNENYVLASRDAHTAAISKYKALPPPNEFLKEIFNAADRISI